MCIYPKLLIYPPPPHFPFVNYFCCSVAKSYQTLCDPLDCSMPGFPACTISPSLLKLMSIELVMPSNHLIFCHPLLLLPSTFSSIRVFSNELALRTRWHKYWSFSFGISPSSEDSGLISFTMDWLDLFAVQGTHKSSSPALPLEGINSLALSLFCGPILRSFMTTVKTIALTIWAFVRKVMFLLFDTLSRFVTDACSLEGKFLISWLQSLSAVTLEPKKRKVCHCFHFFPIYLP